MAPLLEAQGLWKSYDGRQPVLQGLDLTAEAGDALLVWGRNGSGKTTLLNLLGCLDRPDRGRVLLEGRDVTALGPRGRARVRRDALGFVFQDHNLLGELTVRQNVRLPLDLRRDPEAKTRTTTLLARLGLEGFADRRPAQLSRGERQKVAVARALANEPRILLADEPTASLDEESARDLLGLLEGLRREGRTILLATHDRLARELGWPVRRLREGRLEADAPG